MGVHLKQEVCLEESMFEFPELGGEIFLSNLEDLDWSKANYIVYTIQTENEWVVPLIVRFYNAADEVLQVTSGTIPQTEVVVAVPLSALDAQNVFLPRTPGKLKTLVLGTKMKKEDITRISIGTSKNYKPQRFILKDMYLSSEEPTYSLPDKKLVDPLGQDQTKEWQGKTKGEQELISYLQSLVGKEEEFPVDWSSYGGWKEKRFDATGFFRTEHDGQRWWLVDPEGYAFWSAGIDCVSPGVTGLLNDIEQFYEWLPDKEGKYRDMYVSDERGLHYADFAVANLIRAYGENYQQEWTKITTERMKEWRFNTVGNWSSLKFIKNAKTPYVWPLKDFPRTEKTIFRDFPDVYSNEYLEKSKRFAQQLEEFKDDPYMIGYFLTNEPLWAFAEEIHLAEDLLEKEELLESKLVFVKNLADKYGGIEKFNEAWNVNFSSFEDLKKPLKNASKLSSQANQDLDEFTRELIHQYTKIVCNAVKKVDHNHLNLGMRYAWISSDSIFEGSKLFDVFTLNNYSMAPSAEMVMEVSQKSGLPVLIGEFHFGAPDVGLSSTGLRAVTTQTERGKAYRYYIENGAAIPALVGSHYFTLSDQAPLGRFDGENFQIGIVDICHKPYQDFVEGIIAAHENLYVVADNRKEPTTEQANEIPRIGF